METFMEYLLIILSIALTTSGQLLQKLGAMRSQTDSSRFLMNSGMLFRLEIMGGLACLGIGACLWLVVLSKMDVSQAYPFLSLGFVFVLLLSRFYLQEAISPARWLGVAFIAAGLVCVAQT